MSTSGTKYLIYRSTKTIYRSHFSLYTFIINKVPDLCEDLLSSVDQPLKIARDTNGKDYLLCDYNRDGDSYRSPWSNKYDPDLEDGAVPSDKLRSVEIDANAAFDQYREM